MTDINLLEIACYCVNECKQEITFERSYLSTDFFAITKDANVIMSQTPHILQNAEQCILIHRFNQYNPEYRKNYLNIDLQIINKEGSVSTGSIDERFCLTSNCYRELGLSLNENGTYNNLLTFTDIPYHESIKQIWKLYSIIKDLKSADEMKLAVELFKKDEQIFELKKQIENFSFTNYLLEQQNVKYRSLLDKISDLLH